MKRRIEDDKLLEFRRWGFQRFCPSVFLLLYDLSTCVPRCPHKMCRSLHLLDPPFWPWHHEPQNKRKAQEGDDERLQDPHAVLICNTSRDAVVSSVPGVYGVYISGGHSQRHDRAPCLTQRRTPSDCTRVQLWRQDVNDDHDDDRVHWAEQNTDDRVQDGIGDQVVDRPYRDLEGDAQDGADCQL